MRSAADEKKLNEIFKAVFKGPAGKTALDYLKSITLNSVNGPGIDTNSLMHLEGQRFLVGLINRRVEDGRNGIPDAGK